MDFTGRDVVVTGGAGALGGAVLAAFLAAGARCHVPLRGAAARLTAAAGLRAVPGVDLTDEAAVASFYAGVPALWASIHLAGGFAYAAIADTDAALLRGQIEANLTSAYLCCRAAAGAMRRSGGGRIVNVASRPALQPKTGARMTAYTAAKAGVLALTVALAEELAADHILVNAIAPGIIDTPANRAAMPNADRGGWSPPDGIAATILRLAAPEQTASGEVLRV